MTGTDDEKSSFEPHDLVAFQLKGWQLFAGMASIPCGLGTVLLVLATIRGQASALLFLLVWSLIVLFVGYWLYFRFAIALSVSSRGRVGWRTLAGYRECTAHEVEVLWVTRGWRGGKWRMLKVRGMRGPAFLVAPGIRDVVDAISRLCPTTPLGLGERIESVSLSLRSMRWERCEPHRVHINGPRRQRRRKAAVTRPLALSETSPLWVWTPNSIHHSATNFNRRLRLFPWSSSVPTVARHPNRRLPTSCGTG